MNMRLKNRYKGNRVIYSMKGGWYLLKMDKVAGSGNDEFYTPDYAITPLEKYLLAPPV